MPGKVGLSPQIDIDEEEEKATREIELSLAVLDSRVSSLCETVRGLYSLCGDAPPEEQIKLRRLLRHHYIEIGKVFDGIA